MREKSQEKQAQIKVYYMFREGLGAYILAINTYISLLEDRAD